MKKSFAILSVSLFIGFTAGVFLAGAKSPDNIQYPVKELGGCKSKTECKAYCDKIENVDVCVNVGLKLGLISQKEAEEARKFAKIGKGPGGCKSKAQCDSYCGNMDHLNECLSFAEKHNILSPAELNEAKKVAKAISEGAKPPGGCKSKKQCESYCQNPQNIEACIEFGKAAGFISKKEMAELKKILPLMKAGQMPGGCTSKKACEKYCEDSSHIKECMNFAVKAGFISKEEAEMVIKTGGKGPGGCKSKKSCDKFCKKPENEKTCFEFGMKYGMIPKKELEKMKKGMAEMKKSLGEASPEVLSCLKQGLGVETIAKIQKGELAFMGQNTGKIMDKCWNLFKPKDGGPKNQGSKSVPPDVKQCILQIFGKEYLEKLHEKPMPKKDHEKLDLCLEKMNPKPASKKEK